MSDSHLGQTARTVPILQPHTLQTSAPSPKDPMEVTPPAGAIMAPPTRTSEENDANGTIEHMGIDQMNTGLMAGPNAAAAAATGAQQPKVVQTAFIHKLYK